MKKKLLAIFGAIASLALLAGCQTTEEPQHTHTWATEWTTDGTHHWKECTDESCEEVHEKTAHSGGTATCIAEKECEVCGEAYGEKAEHVWDNVCDTECNTDGCGETRTVEHVWDNVCDTECNTEGCGETRTVEHVYDSVCDGECNTEGCGETRTPEAHVWTNVCDTTCDNDGCQETRTVEHVWDNACDTECNTEGCGETREIQHDFATTAFYTKATTMQAGVYAIVTGSNAAKAVPAENTYGYLKVEAMAEKAATLASPATDILFVFAQVEGGYTIQDVNGRYLYMSGNYNNVNVSATLPSEGHVWTVAIDGEGAATIVNVLKGKTMQWDPEFKTYGIYANVDKALPALYAVSGTNLESDGTDHWTTCTICGAESEKTAHSGGTATCETKKECEVCGTSYGDFADHDYVKQNKDDTHHWMECACGTVDEDTKVAHECEWVTTNAKYDFYVCECGHVGAEFKKSLSVLRQELWMTGNDFSIVLDGVGEYASVASIMLGEYNLGTDLAALDVKDELKADTQSHGDQTIVVTVVDAADVQHAISVPVRIITKTIGTVEEFKENIWISDTKPAVYGYYILTANLVDTQMAVAPCDPNWSTESGFFGTFDGAGYYIQTCPNAVTNAGGLFGVLRGATIKNLTIKDQYSKTWNGAVLLGKAAIGCTIENVNFVITGGQQGACNMNTGIGSGWIASAEFSGNTLRNVSVDVSYQENGIGNVFGCKFYNNLFENVVVKGTYAELAYCQELKDSAGNVIAEEGAVQLNDVETITPAEVVKVAFKETQTIDLGSDSSAIDLKDYADAELVSIKTENGFDFIGLKAANASSTLKKTLSAHGETTITVTVITADEKVVEITIPAIIATKTITTMADLQNSVKATADGQKVYGYYILAADVKDTEEGFTPVAGKYDWIGNTGFYGTLVGATKADGSKYTITFAGSRAAHGIFGELESGAVVENIKFVNTYAHGAWGNSIFGYNGYNATIRNVDVEIKAVVDKYTANDQGELFGYNAQGMTFENVTITSANEVVLDCLFKAVGSGTYTNVVANVYDLTEIAVGTATVNGITVNKTKVAA